MEAQDAPLVQITSSGLWGRGGSSCLRDRIICLSLISIGLNMERAKESGDVMMIMLLMEYRVAKH